MKWHKCHSTYGYYARVRLSYNGEGKWYLVHRLVAQAFIPNSDNLPEVNHKDENKLNNCVDNLEWCTKAYNLSYNGLRERVEHKWTKPVICVETRILYESIRIASKETGVLASMIGTVCNKKRHTAGGYHWKYASDLTEPDMKFYISNEKSVKCIETGIIYNSMQEAGRKTGCRPDCISRVCRGNGKTTGGFHWEYIEK